MRRMHVPALLRPARLAAVPRLVSGPLSGQRNMSVSGLMQERPLLVSQLIDYAAKVHSIPAFPCLLGSLHPWSGLKDPRLRRFSRPPDVRG